MLTSNEISLLQKIEHLFNGLNIQQGVSRRPARFHLRNHKLTVHEAIFLVRTSFAVRHAVDGKPRGVEKVRLLFEYNWKIFITIATFFLTILFGLAFAYFRPIFQPLSIDQLSALAGALVHVAAIS
jgi:hypothetical protein